MGTVKTEAERAKTEKKKKVDGASESCGQMKWSVSTQLDYQVEKVQMEGGFKQ